MADRLPEARLRDEVRDRRWLHEASALGLLGATALFAVGGALAAALGIGSAAQAGRTAVAVGLLAAVGAAAATASLGTLRRMRRSSTGGLSYDAMRAHGGLRLSAMLLQLLEIVGAIVVVGRVAVAVGIIDLQLRFRILEEGILFLGAALAAALSAAVWNSLRAPAERQRSTFDSIAAGLALGVAGALGLAAAAAALGRAGIVEAWVLLGPEDAAGLALAGYVAAAFAVTRLRSLPTLTWLVYEERGHDRGRPLGANRTTAVLVPAILAFSLLVVVFLLFLLFGIGVGDLFLSVSRSPLLIGVLAFLLLALLASLAIAFTLARTARADTALYKVLPDAEVRRRRAILVSSGLVATLFMALATLAFTGTGLPRGAWLHMLCLGLLSALGPYGFYAAREHNRVRRMEERLPDFLRDIASSHKGGLTLHQSAAIAARGEYGDLTPEVRKMADQLSWNVSFSEALQRFAERVQTPLVQRAVSLIRQADMSGGATTDVLLAAARDAREIKNLENERRATMGLYTVVVYITFFVFLAVAAVLYAQFAPQIVASANAVQGLGEEGVTVEGLGGDTLDLAQYQLFYFLAAVVQGLGDGLVAGLLGNGRAVLGLRHSFLMVLVSYVTFAFLL